MENISSEEEEEEEKEEKEKKEEEEEKKKEEEEEEEKEEEVEVMVEEEKEEEEEKEDRLYGARCTLFPPREFQRNSSRKKSNHRVAPRVTDRPRTTVEAARRKREGRGTTSILELFYQRIFEQIIKFHVPKEILKRVKSIS
ncbi:hypothetical protein V1477_015808 [Vespula maculifrons]|uniref:Uncharacterized protein n=1 Tax=Vespula maculifrons TaxID=7453 RepID=A0ABD2BB86_VESMC